VPEFKKVLKREKKTENCHFNEFPVDEFFISIL